MAENGVRATPEKTRVTYEVVRHEGFWAYRVGDTYSESFATEELAALAAREAALRQAQEGPTEAIEYQDEDGTWRMELADGSDRPEADVELAALEDDGGRSESAHSGKWHRTRRWHRRFFPGSSRYVWVEDDPDAEERPRVALADSFRELVRDHPLKIVLSAALVGLIASRFR